MEDGRVQLSERAEALRSIWVISIKRFLKLSVICRKKKIAIKKLILDDI